MSVQQPYLFSAVWPSVSSTQVLQTNENAGQQVCMYICICLYSTLYIYAYIVIYVYGHMTASAQSAHNNWRQLQFKVHNCPHWKASRHTTGTHTHICFYECFFSPRLMHISATLTFTALVAWLLNFFDNTIFGQRKTAESQYFFIYYH